LTAVLTDLADEAFQADFKYDGVRAQIHLEADGTVHIFSRHLENVTDRYPDAVAAVRKAVAGTGVKSLIADTEIVAWDRTVHEILPFQMLMSRPRKNVALADVTVQVKIFFFDLMGGCFLRAIHFLAAVVSNPCSSLCHPPLHPITFLKAINFCEGLTFTLLLFQRSTACRSSTFRLVTVGAPCTGASWYTRTRWGLRHHKCLFRIPTAVVTTATNFGDFFERHLAVAAKG
jgi:hypothetical protein